MGTRVRIASAVQLVRFRTTWKLHHPLSDEQLAAHDGVAVVSKVSYDHGGEPLYELQATPGTWHERCLRIAETQARVRRIGYWIGVAGMFCAMWWGLGRPPDERRSRYVVAVGFVIAAFGAWSTRGEREGPAVRRGTRFAAGLARSALLAAIGFGLAFATILIICLFVASNYYASMRS